MVTYRVPALPDFAYPPTASQPPAMAEPYLVVIFFFLIYLVLPLPIVMVMLLVDAASLLSTKDFAALSRIAEERGVRLPTESRHLASRLTKLAERMSQWEQREGSSPSSLKLRH